MRVTAIKTRKVVAGAISLSDFLDESIKHLAENSVLAITSKVVAICEGRVLPVGSVEKDELVKREADYFLPEEMSKYGFSFTITHHTLIPLAGIDESNGDGNYVLWPKDPIESANRIKQHLRQRFGLKNLGVVITDSTARPLHYGTEGVAIAYSGFAPSNDYIGKKDLFGRKLKVSIANIADALSASAVVVMGEGSEQTPLAVISELPFVKFQDHDPTAKELRGFYLEHMRDDLFAPFLRNMGWRKGGSSEYSD